MRVWLVLGSGGHTTEMLKTLKILTEAGCLNGAELTAVKANNDDHSKIPPKLDRLITLPRLRPVGGSWILAMYRLIIQTLWVIYLVSQKPPKILLVNGPGTCVPVVYAVAIVRAIYYRRGICKIIYIESFCRTRSLSLSAQACLPFVDK